MIHNMKCIKRLHMIATYQKQIKDKGVLFLGDIPEIVVHTYSTRDSFVGKSDRQCYDSWWCSPCTYHVSTIRSCVPIQDG